MSADFLADLVDHKRRVTRYLGLISASLLRASINYGQYVAYIPDPDQATLLTLLEVAFHLRHEGRVPFPLRGQVETIVRRTVHHYLPEARSVMDLRYFVVNDLFQRAAFHDLSKLGKEEFDLYAQAFPSLQREAYGTPAFQAILETITPAIQHHYQVNDHHPEHFSEGLVAMHLVQLSEMLCDQLAASERSQTPFTTGMELINRSRFHIDEHLFPILLNTARAFSQQGEPDASA